MSTPPRARGRRTSASLPGLPTWAATLIIIASLVTGLLVSLYFQEVGLPFLLCFAVGAIATTTFVNIRGIFLTVVSQPTLFAIGIFATAWVINRSQASEGTPAFSRATVLTTVFPLVQQFPWVAGVALLSLIIGLLRLWLMRRRLREFKRNEDELRVRTAEEDRRNRSLSASARRRSSRGDQVTVEELLARAKTNSGNDPRPRRGDR